MDRRTRLVAPRVASHPTPGRDLELTGARDPARMAQRSRLSNAQGRGALPFPCEAHSTPSFRTFCLTRPR